MGSTAPLFISAQQRMAKQPHIQDILVKRSRTKETAEPLSGEGTSGPFFCRLPSPHVRPDACGLQGPKSAVLPYRSRTPSIRINCLFCAKHEYSYYKPPTYGTYSEFLHYRPY